MPACAVPVKAAHPDGEIAGVTAAAKAGVPYCVPHYGGYPLPDVNAAGLVFLTWA